MNHRERSRALLAPYIESGVLTADDVEMMLDGSDAVREQLARRECPSCKGVVTRARDARQDGPSGHPGTWFNYRCLAKCGFMLDAIEEPN